MTNELKPCPDLRCGKEAQVIDCSTVSAHAFMVTCLNVFCGCKTDVYGTQEQAIKRWNKRPYENQLKVESFIAGAEWQENAQAFDYDIGIDLQRQKAAEDFADKIQRGEV